MMRFFMLIPMVALAACSGSDDKDTATGTDAGATDTVGDDDDDTAGDDDDDDGCSNGLTSSFPENGATTASYRTDVIATLEEEDSAATIAIDGVTGMTMIDGVVVSFTPDAPLAPSTSYTATLTYACGTEEWTFTTSSVGGATDEVALLDGAYSLDLSSGTWILPPGVGSVIGDLIEGVEVLFGVTAVNGATLTMIGAVGDGTGNADICYPTLDFPVDPSWNNPYFEVEAPQLLIAAGGLEIAIDDLFIGGAFTPDASSIQGGALRGVIDTRPLVEELAPGGGDSAVCDLVAVLGVDCEPCADSSPTCLSVWVTDIVAENVPNVIVPREEADPSCATE